MFKKKFLLKLGLEILAIIIGITASFWISDISAERDKEIQRERVLKSILIESDDIKNYCEERMKIWNQDIDIYNLLINDKLNIEKLKKIAISKNRVEYNLIYYRDFTPPMNRYRSIINTGDLKYIQSENIKELFSRLHNLNFSKVVSTVEYEKKIIELIIELISDENPSLFLKGNNSKINFENYLKSLHKFVQENEKLKSNLIVQMKYFKTRISSLKVYMLTLDELKNILKVN
ncbi:hypothetical protein OAQ80_02185 [Flavobacteriaceae bacterium]|nr:hypothetical protein [Flavobacteriaceae bacterium]|tara:strand:- start:3065 stop:3763 length:699 start_codon:yes stop_codon:yes gene_type:complete